MSEHAAAEMTSHVTSKVPDSYIKNLVITVIASAAVIAIFAGSIMSLNMYNSQTVTPPTTGAGGPTTGAGGPTTGAGGPTYGVVPPTTQLNFSSQKNFGNKTIWVYYETDNTTEYFWTPLVSKFL